MGPPKLETHRKCRKSKGASRSFDTRESFAAPGKKYTQKVSFLCPEKAATIIGVSLLSRRVICPCRPVLIKQTAHYFWHSGVEISFSGRTADSGAACASGH